jgi:predicted PurR-regulated permease PerM
MEIENKPININITPSSIFKGIGLVLLVWFLYYIKDVVLVVLVSVVIASGMEPLITWFKKYKVSRLPASIISYVGIFSIFIALIFFFVPPVLDEASSFLNDLPQYLETTSLWNPLNVSTESVSTSQQVVNTLSAGINGTGQLVKTVTQGQTSVAAPAGTFGLEDLIKGIQSITSNFSTNFIKIISAIFGGLLSFILILVLSFYFLVQEDGVADFLKLITPLRNEKYVVDLWKRSQRKIGQWMQGQFLLGIIIAVLLYLGLMILGVKDALLLAVLAGLLEIIPVFGPIISAVPAIIIAFVGGGFTAAILVLGLYLIVQQFESHLIYPLVVKKVVGVSPILVILALIIGAKLAGFLGIVLSAPAVAALMEFFDDVGKRKVMQWQKVEEKSKA